MRLDFFASDVETLRFGVGRGRKLKRGDKGAAQMFVGGTSGGGVGASGKESRRGGGGRRDGDQTKDGGPATAGSTESAIGDVMIARRAASADFADAGVLIAGEESSDGEAATADFFGEWGGGSDVKTTAQSFRMLVMRGGTREAAGFDLGFGLGTVDGAGIVPRIDAPRYMHE